MDSRNSNSLWGTCCTPAEGLCEIFRDVSWLLEPHALHTLEKFERSLDECGLQLRAITAHAGGVWFVAWVPTQIADFPTRHAEERGRQGKSDV